LEEKYKAKHADAPTIVSEPDKAWDLKARTKAFALQCIKLVEALPNSDTGRVIGKQILRSSTSVGANYRAASLAQSKASFIAKLSIVLEEADECCYWLALIVESKLMSREKVNDLYDEAVEPTKIFAASRIKAKSNGN